MVGAPVHTTWSPIAFTVAVGFTVMLNVVVVPSQVTVLFVKCGVTVMVAVTGVEPLFTPLNEAMPGPVRLCSL